MPEPGFHTNPGSADIKQPQNALFNRQRTPRNLDPGSDGDNPVNQVFSTVYQARNASPDTETDLDPVDELLSTAPLTKRPDSAVNTRVPAWKRYQQGDQTVAGALLQELTPTIDRAIHTFANDDPSYKTQARILSLNAVKSYDPSKKTQLSSHVFNHLQRLQRLSAQRGNLIYVPENAALQRRAIEKARDEYELEHGEEPTVEELADLMGISIKKINKLMSYGGTTSESATQDEHGDSLAGSSVEHALDLYDRYIYEELDRVDKKIYEWSTGFGGSKRLNRAEMAKRLGISESAVSQRASSIARKFNEDREMIRRAFYANN